MKNLFGQIYKNRKVLITGHTGFKGSWLGLWLSRMGAKVVGYALAPPTTPNHFELLNLEYTSVISDVRDGDRLQAVIAEQQPEIIFHLAAQSLVRRGYHEPVETFSTNVMGVVNLLQACRQSPGLKAVVVVTSDKCYENMELEHAYCESDALGGYDTYSASKGCAEIVTSSYRRSFFPVEQYTRKHSVLIASARAGNVIGGGDWSQDRLIPDIVKAVGKNEKAIIRNPDSTRPWQHTLESLSGYLLLGQRLLEGKSEFAEAWNFGPDRQESVTVKSIVDKLREHWSRIEVDFASEPLGMHEAELLKLDCSKAFMKLGWKPVWNISEALKMTIEWYQMFYENHKVISEQQLLEYINAAARKNLEWAEL